MSSIDNRIVNMKFDNKQFEKGVAETTKTLANFNQDLNKMSSSSVDFGGMSKGIDKVASRFSWFGDLAYTAMHRVNEAILDAAQTMMRYGKMITSPFEGAADGFSEYELKMGAVQTIMAGVRDEFENEDAALAGVNEKLNELNNYSDRTIYSFKDMTQNIGKFTNAGVSLDESVAAIQGIANAAALSGANSNEASRAMYNFAQALSKGYVQLIDWKSIENANMATEEFKDQLLEGAVAAGTLTKGVDGMYYQIGQTQKAGTGISATKDFNDTLKDGWLTSEVLIDVLGDYADATTDVGKRATDAATKVKTFSQLMDTVKESLGSGWAQSFELIIGNFVEARDLWTNVNKVIGDYIGQNADARNEMIKTWKVMGGRTVLIKGIADGFNAITSVVGAIKNGFRDIFPPTTVTSLLNATKAFGNFMAALKPSEETIVRFRRVARGLASVLDILLIPVRALIDGIKLLFAPFNDAAASGESFINVIFEIIADIADFITAIRNAIKECTSFADLFQMISDAAELTWIDISAGLNKAFGGIITIASTQLKKLATFIKTYFKDFSLSSVFNFEFGNFRDVLPALQDYAQKIRNFIETYFTKLLEFGKTNPIITGLVNGMLSGIEKVKAAIIFVGQWIKQAFCDLLGIESPSKVFYEYGVNIWEGLINGLKTLGKGVIYIIQAVGELIINAFGPIVDVVHGFLVGMGDDIWATLNKANESFNEFTYNLAHADLSPLDYIRKKFDEFNVENSTFGNIVLIFQNIIDFFKPLWFWAQDTFGPLVNYIWEKINLITPGNIAALFAGYGVHSAGVGLLQFLSGINATLKPFTEGLGGLFRSFGKIADGLSGLMGNIGDTFKSFQMKIKADALRSIAMSFIMLAAAFGLFGLLPWDVIGAAVTGMGAAAAALSVVFFTLSKVNLAAGGGINLMAIASGILVLSWALENLAGIDLLPLLVSAGVLAGLFTGLYFFVDKIDAGKLAAIGASMVGFGGGIYLLSWGIENLGELDLGALIKGVVGLFGAFGGMAVVLNKFPFRSVPRIPGLALGLMLFAAAIYMYSKLDFFDTVVPGLISLGAALGLIVGTLALVTRFGISLRGTGLVGLSMALLLLIVPLAVLGNMEWDIIWEGLKAIGASLVVLVAAVAVLSLLKGDQMMKLSIGILALVAAIIALIIPIQLLGTTDWGVLWVGLGVMAGILAGLVLALQQMPSNENMIKNAIAIGALAASLAVLGLLVKVLGNTDIGVIGKGLLILGGAFAALAGSFRLIPKDFGKMALQILAVAGALGILMGVVTLMGNLLEWPDVFQALVGLGGVLLIVGAALYFMPKMKDLKDILIGLGAMAGVLTILSVPLLLLSTLSWDQIKNGLLGLAGVAVILTLSLAALGVVATIFPGLGEAAQGLGIVLGGFGALIAGVGAAVYYFAAGLHEVVDSLEAWSIWWNTPGKFYNLSLKDNIRTSGLEMQRDIEESVDPTSMTDKIQEMIGESVSALIGGGAKMAEAGERTGSKVAEGYEKGIDKINYVDGLGRVVNDETQTVKGASDATSAEMLDYVKNLQSTMSFDGNAPTIPSELQQMFAQGSNVINTDGADMTKLMAGLPPEIQKSFKEMGGTSGYSGITDLNKMFQSTVQTTRSGNTQIRRELSQQSTIYGQYIEDRKQNDKALHRQLQVSKENRAKFDAAMAKDYSGYSTLSLNQLPEKIQEIFKDTSTRIFDGGKELTNGLTNFQALIDEKGNINVNALSEGMKAYLFSQRTVFLKEQGRLEEIASDVAKGVTVSFGGELNPAYSKALSERFVGSIIQTLSSAGPEINNVIMKLGEDGKIKLFDPQNMADTELAKNAVKNYYGQVITVAKMEGDKLVERVARVSEDGTLDFVQHFDDAELIASIKAGKMVKSAGDAIEKESVVTEKKAEDASKKTADGILSYLTKTDIGKGIIGKVFDGAQIGDAKDTVDAVVKILDDLGVDVNTAVAGMDLGGLEKQMGDSLDKSLGRVREAKGAATEDAKGLVAVTAKALKEQFGGEQIQAAAKVLPDVISSVFKTGQVDVGAAADALGNVAVTRVADAITKKTEETFDSETVGVVRDALTTGLTASLQNGQVDVKAGAAAFANAVSDDVVTVVTDVVKEKVGDGALAPVGDALGAGLTAAVKDGEVDVKAGITAMGEVISTETTTMVKKVVEEKLSSTELAPVGDALSAGLTASVQNGQVDVKAGITAFGNAISDDVTTMATEVVTDITAGTKLEPVADAAVAGVTASLQNGQVDVKAGVTAFGNAISADVTAVANQIVAEGTVKEPAKVIGKEAGSGVVEGLNESSQIATESLEVIKTEFSAEKTVPVGKMLPKGLAQGIREGSPEVKAAAQEMAKSAVTTTQQTLEIKSPSQVFAEIGSYVDQGFANGITQNMPYVTNATKKMGDTTTESLTEAMSNVNYNHMTELNVEPTIRPVLDLSDVEKNAKTIPALLNRNVAVVSAGGGAKAMKNFNGYVEQKKGTGLNYNSANPQKVSGIQVAPSPTITNNYNVRNESDARTISNNLATIMRRSAYAQGRVATA